MTISIVFGGVSYEHEISIVSAIALIKKLEKINIEKLIFLDLNHDFYLIEKANMKSTYFSSKSYKKAQKIYIGQDGFYEKGLLGNKMLNCGVILNLIHGGDGEDGVLASLFDFYNIDFIGPRLEACVLSYNKHLTKLYAIQRDVKVLDYAIKYQYESFDYKSEIINQNKHSMNFPFIMKPNRAGSSIGIQIVKDENEIEYALDSAFEYDNEVIIENFIANVKEYNIAGMMIKDEYFLSIIEEPEKKEFLNFDKKYLDFSRTGDVKNANVNDEITQKLQEAFKKLYKNKFEGALIRCDFFVIDDEVYLNEINPIPGSMSNYLFEDFESTLLKLATNLPKKRKINIDYKYINKIKSAKGKV